MSDFLVPLANAIFGEIASVLIFLVSFNGQHWRRNDWCTFCSPNKHLTNILHGCIKILWKKWLLDLELTFRQNKTPLHSKNHQQEQLMIIVHWKVPSRTALGDLAGWLPGVKGLDKSNTTMEKPERWEELFEKRPMGCAVYSINYLVKVVESILELVPWGARCWKNPWLALFCFSPFYILPPIVVTLLYHSLILASHIKDVGECIKVCIVAGGGAMLSVTFAGQPVKGAKRILTTENKSSFVLYDINNEVFTIFCV